ncbi:hypothetical protein [Cesiribacter sp. SM1]|uniref:hypothetical protein n=1 Tax=Cesiribacter sp. SM1 TaxID=2861196 RepID=UPI001CD38410|nr:hypothetical protein [Cesiribacter sp. SM1]
MISEANRILEAFPADLRADVNSALDIIPFSDKNVKLSDGMYHLMDNLIHPSELNITLNNESLTLPYRLYFNEPDLESEEKLTDRQKAILNSIYLRHHNGYVRERRLRHLTNTNEYWLIPFTVQLLGEYVYEILEVLDKHVNEDTLDLYADFAAENPKYWQKTESRMISYWDVYHRRKYPKLKEYLGYRIIKKIKRRPTTE